MKSHLDNSFSPVTSIYTPKYAVKHWNFMYRFFSGKILYVIEENNKFNDYESFSLAMFENENLIKRHKNFKDEYQMEIYTPHTQISSDEIGLKNNEFINNKLKSSMINIHNNMKLSHIDPVNKIVTFLNKATNESVTSDYDILHIMPRFQLPKFLSETDLVNKDGYIDVDPKTFQHTRYNNVWCFGGCSNLKIGQNLNTLKTIAPIIIHNIKNRISNQKNYIEREFNGKWTQQIYLGNKNLYEIPMIWNEYDNKTDFLGENRVNKFNYFYSKYIVKPSYLELLKRGL